jgi:hypothetical protein
MIGTLLIVVMQGENDMLNMPNYKFKLYTEEELKNICNEKPVLKDYTFEGFCIQTQNCLLFGPGAQKSDRCPSCFPNSHFYLVPLDLLGADETIEEKPSEKISSSSERKSKHITLIKS